MKHAQIVALSARIAGRPRPTLDGRELSLTEFNSFDGPTQARVVHRVNGPHGDAKWARDAATRGISERHKALFFGSDYRMTRKEVDGYHRLAVGGVA